MKDRSKFGKELYNPDNYEPEELPLKVDEHKISVKEAQQFGEMTTCVRKELKG